MKVIQVIIILNFNFQKGKKTLFLKFDKISILHSYKKSLIGEILEEYNSNDIEIIFQGLPTKN